MTGPAPASAGPGLPICLRDQERGAGASGCLSLPRGRSVSRRRPRMTSLPAQQGEPAGEPRVFRPASVTYLRIPAPQPGAAAEFYRRVFGWTVEARHASMAFEDGSGHVIGHFVNDRNVVGDAGIIPYVYVEDVDSTLEATVASRGEVVRPPHGEGDLRVATIRDVAGNVVGIWQHVSPPTPADEPPSSG
jgi:predicted enzyme related to lactoylglutathione lyase